MHVFGVCMCVCVQIDVSVCTCACVCMHTYTHERRRVNSGKRKNRRPSDPRSHCAHPNQSPRRVVREIPSRSLRTESDNTTRAYRRSCVVSAPTVSIGIGTHQTRGHHTTTSTTPHPKSGTRDSPVQCREYSSAHTHTDKRVR